MIKHRMPIFYPLFHGTNTKALNMSNEERKNAYIVCKYVARLSYDFLIKTHITSKNKDINELNKNIELLRQTLENPNAEGYKLAKDNIDNLFDNIDDKESIVTAIRLFYYLDANDKYFEYGDYYLTLDLNRAKEYALNGTSFGEISVIANNLYIQAKHDGILNELTDNDKEMIASFEKVINNTGDPIVLKYEVIYEDELLHENGDEVTEEEWKRYADYSSYPSGFRVKKGVNLEDRLKDTIHIK